MSETTKSASIWFIFFTILLDAVGIGILIPVFPDILRRFTSDPEEVSKYFGVFVGTYAVMQFFASPILGSLADRYGRKPILLISLLGAGLDYLFMAFAPTLPLLFLGRALSGLTGASMTVASSYMADISNDKNRSANFGMIGAGWGVGFITGPVLGGLIGGHFGHDAPFITAAILNLLNFAFGIFVLPESLPKERRRMVELKKLNPFLSIAKILRPSPIFVLVIIYFLLFLAGQVHPVNFTLFTQTKFGWSAWEVGLAMSFVGVVIAISQITLPRFVVPKIGESTALAWGIFFYASGFTLFGVVPQAWMIYPALAYFALSGLAMPALQSMISKHVNPNEQGETQGSLVALGALACIIAPVLFTYLFVHFTKADAPMRFEGAAYIGAGLVCALALILKLVVPVKEGKISLHPENDKKDM